MKTSTASLLRAALVSLACLAATSAADAQVVVRGPLAASELRPVAQGGYYGRGYRRPRMVRVTPAPVIVRPQPAPVVIIAPPPPAPPPVVPAPPPPPSDAHGILVLGDTRLVVGQAVRANWGAGWFDAQVTALRPDGTVRIHYTGYSEMWDEDVSRVRIRLPR